MGLDVALGVIILIAAIRGWLQGFLYQAIRIGGLIACVYAGVPVRDQLKPYALPYLPAIQPELMDRLLWWVSAGLSYVVIVGVSTLLLKITRRPEIPGLPPQRNRNDQFAGFLLGIAKGALVGAFLVAGLQRYALKQIETIPWADQQARNSLALRWDERYHPAERIWKSGPVRQFVGQIQRLGLPDRTESPDDTDGPVVQTARKGSSQAPGATKRAEEARVAPPAAPAPRSANPKVPDPEVERAAEDIRAALEDPSKPR